MFGLLAWLLVAMLSTTQPTINKVDETFWCENLKKTTCWVERTIQMVNYRLISLALTIAVPFTPDMV